MRSLMLSLGVLLLGACGGPLPNGKEGVLEFKAAPDMIRSADYGVLIPSSWYEGGGALGLDTEYEYDFTGTELETSTTGGLTVLSTGFDRISDRDYRIRLRCGGEHGKKEELRVRIHSGWQTHYEDAFDITCWEPNEFTFEDKGPWITQTTFVGAMGVAFNGEQGRVELSRQFQDEYYVELADPEGRLGYTDLIGPDRPQYLWQLLFQTQVPGKGVELLLGERRITFPVEVLPDEAWDLDVKLVSSSATQFPTPGTVHHVQASAVPPGGDALRSLDDCQWAVRSGAVEGLPTYRSCSVYVTPRGSSAVLCAQSRGKEACLTLSP